MERFTGKIDQRHFEILNVVYQKSVDLERKKDLHFKLIAVIGEELYNWAEKSKSTMGFVSFGGLLQVY